jgi:hypothetical protein
MPYTKEDVRTHYGSERPAVNVKVYDTLEDVSLPLCLGGVADLVDGRSENFRWTYTDEGFTHEWIREHVSDELADAIFWQACADAVEMIGEDARDIFDRWRVEIEQDGRSGGWIVVTGLPEIEEWDAVLLSKWRKFEKQCHAYRDDLMRSVVDSIYANEWEAAQAERLEEEPPHDAAELLHAERR